ncbi:TRAP-type C4-dicarboxylate transport system permease large subunit [Oceanisphaera litoralis]|uniref:hypothetical protein n=1 Tax=Oceanisphaera litoralis TaxID=225144 RepID=UPI00195A88AD|nr:hypothetical protein [Oceanisphaera litoralis]MBM7455403.1 TRAP-type C4-dicarboxylate transport system permease large subunit [Oceanisphaera litoralis]
MTCLVHAHPGRLVSVRERLNIDSGVSGTSIEDISLRALPLAITSVIALFIIAYIAQITLFLPRLLGY